MRRWFRDTLFLRLFLLMWAALVISHLAAFSVVTAGWLGEHRLAAWRLPIFPSLPPTPGLPQVTGDGGPPFPPDGGRRPPPDGFGPGGPMPGGPGGPGGPPDREAGGAGPIGGPATAGGARREPPPSGKRGLPLPLLVLDYGVRILLIGVAAAIAARWLSAPTRRLVGAAGSLSRSLGQKEGPAPLDEHRGTVEVREAARVFNRMARELDAQFRSRALMMAALSHDLKTPLTRMRMRLEADPAGGVATEKSIADIREMSALVDSALDVFRSTSLDEPVQAIDVAALLQAMVDDRAELGQPVTLTAVPAVAQARPMALRRVFDNLLDNAVRYGGAATTVAVSSDAGEVRVTIDDAGPGIPPQLLDTVFQPFFRIDPSRQRSTGGSGLGLYIARDLMLKQGGTVALDNRAEVGLRATVTLPAAA